MSFGDQPKIRRKTGSLMVDLDIKRDMLLPVRSAFVEKKPPTIFQLLAIGDFMQPDDVIAAGDYIVESIQIFRKGFFIGEEPACRIIHQNGTVVGKKVSKCLTGKRRFIRIRESSLCSC